MLYRILADALVVIHFVWIVFMLAGFALTVCAFWKPALFDWWIFRTIHLAGIIFVAALEILGKYCPLTVWENTLRRSYNPSHAYPGSFIVQYIAKLVYPEIDPLVLVIPTVFIAVFTLIVFVLRPPRRFQRAWFVRGS